MEPQKLGVWTVFLLPLQAGGPDYYIEGILHRNRAFNDDLVVINVLPADQWKVCHPIPCSLQLLLEQFIAQTAGENNDGKGTDKDSTNTMAMLPLKHSHDEDDTINELSTVTQDTLTLDSVPAVANDTVNSVKGDEVTAAVNTGATQASNDGSVMDSEVCYYYDSSQYGKVLRETFRAVTAVNGDTTDGDVTASVTTPDLGQIINGHPLRMYKRTAKVYVKIYEMNIVCILLNYYNYFNSSQM